MGGAAEFQVAAQADGQISQPLQGAEVIRSVRVWVGCWWPPSPALMTGISEWRAATRGAPSLGWRMAQISAKLDTTRMVSATLSPLEAELSAPEEKPSTLPPRLSIAASKLNLVRVLGS